MQTNVAQETLFPLSTNLDEPPVSNTPASRLWMPQRVQFTPAALAEEYGQRILKRVLDLGLPVEELKANRLTGLRGDDARGTYNIAKRTLAVVTAPPSAFKLQPIPPSADWQFHIAEGCPAHCQYCYLAAVFPVHRSCAFLPTCRRYCRTWPLMRKTSRPVSKSVVTPIRWASST
jgi:spore photoproduct lyase